MQKQSGGKTPGLYKSHELNERLMISTPNKWPRTWVWVKKFLSRMISLQEMRMY